MYAEIAAALHSAKTLGELLKDARQLANYNELATAVADVTSRLVDAQGVALALQERQAELVSTKAQLESKLRELEAWQDELSRYELTALPTGAYVYRLKSGMERGEPTHYICAACVNERRKSLLQPTGTYLHCPNKHPAVQVRPHQQPRQRGEYF